MLSVMAARKEENGFVRGFPASDWDGLLEDADGMRGAKDSRPVALQAEKRYERAKAALANDHHAAEALGELQEAQGAAAGKTAAKPHRSPNKLTSAATEKRAVRQAVGERGRPLLVRARGRCAVSDR